jgi:FkbM family methyltransferase
MLHVNLVLDVGANRGGFGLALRRGGYTGAIASFEPVRASYDELEHAARRDDLWSTYQLALGDEDGEADINVTAESEFASLGEPTAAGLSQFPGMLDVIRRESVQVRTLESIWSSIAIDRPRVYLKMDTQGYDLDVLQGAGSMLDHVVGLQTEVYVERIYDRAPLYFEAAQAIHELGFRFLRGFPTNEYHLLEQIDQDWVFVRV